MDKPRPFLLTVLAILVLIFSSWFFTVSIFGRADGLGWLTSNIFSGGLGWLTGIILFGGLVIFAGRKAHSNAWIAAGILTLLTLFVPSAMLAEHPPGIPESVRQVLTIGLIAVLVLAPVVGGLLLNSALHQLIPAFYYGASVDGMNLAGNKQSNGKVKLLLFLSSLIIIKLLHNIYWLMVWDGASDSLSYLWLFIPLFGVIFAALHLLINMPARYKMAGIAYTLLVPILLVVVATLGQQVDFRDLTESRAERVTQAIERYYASEGRYPQSLSELTPWPVFSNPGPVIIYGQGWCYQGSSETFQLGYVDREHWSSPYLFSHLYSQKGPFLESTDLCADQIQLLIAQKPGFWLAGP
jgi:hypothetical protein